MSRPQYQIIINAMYRLEHDKDGSGRDVTRTTNNLPSYDASFYRQIYER
jgi:hypothetical protein